MLDARHAMPALFVRRSLGHASGFLWCDCLLQGDRDAPNWLKKLMVAKKLLVDDAPDMRPLTEALAHGYVYLHWISTGKCWQNWD